MSVKLYDEKCLDVATHFLADQPSVKELPNAKRTTLADDLAYEIQQAVDGWMATQFGKSIND